ncbi:MAG TPA: hypothetical protein VFE92_18080 [Dermatophilaceae bacterium]|nr:hypothetical protein [Dermatophilaceae bacterium]
MKMRIGMLTVWIFAERSNQLRQVERRPQRRPPVDRPNVRICRDAGVAAPAWPSRKGRADSRAGRLGIGQAPEWAVAAEYN